MLTWPKTLFGLSAICRFSSDDKSLRDLQNIKSQDVDLSIFIDFQLASIRKFSLTYLDTFFYILAYVQQSVSHTKLTHLKNSPQQKIFLQTFNSLDANFIYIEEL